MNSIVGSAATISAPTSFFRVKFHVPMRDSRSLITSKSRKPVLSVPCPLSPAVPPATEMENGSSFPFVPDAEPGFACLTRGTNRKRLGQAAPLALREIEIDNNGFLFIAHLSQARSSSSVSARFWG